MYPNNYVERLLDFELSSIVWGNCQQTSIIHDHEIKSKKCCLLVINPNPKFIESLLIKKCISQQIKIISYIHQLCQ